MKNLKILNIAIFVIILSSCSDHNNKTLDNILNSRFRVYQISGYQGPKINIKKDSLAVFLVALHYNIPLSEIQSALNWDPETTSDHIHALIENKLLVKKGDYYQPTLGIFALDRGNLLKEKAQKVAHEIADSLINYLPEIKEIHNEMHISGHHDFSELSFFYLINVVLDNFQIQRVEQEFLNQDRPLRNGSRYYLGIVEDDPANTTEPFGMYGNRGLLWNDSIGISVFGNKRLKSNVGWDNYKDKNIYVFDEKDTYMINNKMPETFFPCLLDILKRNKSYFETIYQELGYDEEVSFEEFFIFWYHWIYTETADVLIARDIIQKPKNDMFYYQVAVNY